MSSRKKLKEARRAARKEKRRMEAVPSSDIEKELSDLMGALDKGIGKLRIPVRQGHAVGQALGALANALDGALKEHGKDSREAVAKRYLESVKTEPPEPGLTPEQKAEAEAAYQASQQRESEVLTLTPPQVDKVAADLTEAAQVERDLAMKAQDAAGAA